MALTADQRYLAKKLPGTGPADGLPVYAVDCETYLEDKRHPGKYAGYHTDAKKVYEIAICRTSVGDVEKRQKAKYLGKHTDGLKVYAANCCAPCDLKICVVLLLQCKNVPQGASATITTVVGDLVVCSGPMEIVVNGDGTGYARVCCEVPGVSGPADYRIAVFHTTPHYGNPPTLTVTLDCGEHYVPLFAEVEEGYACCGCQVPGSYCARQICPTWDHIFLTDRYGTHTLPLVDSCNGCQYEICLNPTEPTSRKTVQCWTDPYTGSRGFTLQETGGIISLRYVVFVRCGVEAKGEDPDQWFLEVFKYLTVISACQDEEGDPCCPGKNDREIFWCQGQEPGSCHSYVYGDLKGYPVVARIADVSDCTTASQCNCGPCTEVSTTKITIPSPCDGGPLNATVHLDRMCITNIPGLPPCYVPGCDTALSVPCQSLIHVPSSGGVNCIGGDPTIPNSEDDLTITS